MIGEYTILLSCEDKDLLFMKFTPIGSETVFKGVVALGKAVNSDVISNDSKDFKIECISNFCNVVKTKETFEDLGNSWMYILNPNKEPDWRTGWEIGYIFGKGKENVIVILPEFKDGNGIPSDMKFLLSSLGETPSDMKSFLEKIDRKLGLLTPRPRKHGKVWDELHKNLKFDP